MEKTIKIASETDDILDKDTIRDLEMEQIFEVLPDGYKVSVYREQPSYCDGYQGTEYVSKDCPLDLESLRARYGGRQLRLRVLNQQGQFVTERRIKFPDAPRMEGIIISNPDTVTPKQDNIQTQLLFKLLENSEKSAQRTQEILLSRMDAIEQAALSKAAPSKMEPEQKSPLEQLRETIGAIREIRKVQTELGVAKAEESDEPDPVTTTLTQLVDKYMDVFLAKQKAEIDKTTTKPAAPPALEERKSLRPQEPMEVSSMDHRELALALRERFAALNDNQKREAMDIFMGNADVEYVYNDNNSENENYDENETFMPKDGKIGNETNRSIYENDVKLASGKPSLLAPEDEELLNGTSSDQS